MRDDLLSLVLEATKDGIWEWKTETGEAYFSPSYYTMLGYEPDDFPPSYENFLNLIHPDDRESTVGVINEAMEKHNSYSAEFRMKAKDGSWIWILSRGKAIEVDSEGNYICMVGTHTDISLQKKAEKSLRLARSIIDTANIGIYLLNQDGSIKEVNNSAAELLGYTKEELESLPMKEFDPQAPALVWEETWKRLLQKGRDHLTREHRKKDGTLIPVEITSNLLKIEGNRYAVAFVQDISLRKKNEDLLREKDKMLYDIGSLVKVGAWKYDVATGESVWTDEIARIYDYEPETYVSIERSLTCYHGENHKKITKAFNEAVELGKSYDLELEIITDKGNHKWVRALCIPIIEEGHVVKLWGSFQDITEMKTAESRLRESEKRYRALIETAPLGIGMVDANENIIDCNQSLCVMLGYEREELLRQNLSAITPPDDLGQENLLIESLMEGRRSSYSLEKRYRRKEGSCFWVNVTVSKIEDIYGPGVYLFGFAENISPRKQLEKEREDLIDSLKRALAEITELRGFIPICANCKKVRNDKGYWQQVEQYISDKTAVQCSHSLCPECAAKLYPEIHKKIKD